MSPFIVVEPWERCFELFRMQNSQDFLKLCPWTPLVRFYSASRLPSCTTIFFFAMLVETLVHPPSLPSPKKKLDFGPVFVFLHLCTTSTTNDNHMVYGSWDMEHDRQNFLSFWTIFFLFMSSMLISGKHKSDLGDNLNIFSCKQWLPSGKSVLIKYWEFFLGFRAK